jgi:predicted aspartyl protease
VADGSKPLAFELRGHGIIIPVSVSGAGPFRFLLDTGASRSMIAASVAKRLSVPVRARTMMITPAGHSIRPVAAVTLRLGARSAVPVTATVAADDELAGTRVDGIVGQDVLSGLVYTIDYSRRQIFWDDTMPEADERRLELQFTNGRALVIIPPQAGMPHPLQLIPDTGADHVVLFTRRGRELPPFTPLDIGLLRTLAGQQLVRRVLIDALNVGGVDLLRQSAVILPSDAEALSLADGLLPLHLFSRVTVNGPERYLSVAR